MTEMRHAQLQTCKRWVIKIGSALLTRLGEGLDVDRIRWLSGEIAHMRAMGKEVVLVTSGSVAAGMQRLGWQKRPKALHELQAAASVGQMGLVNAYATECGRHGVQTAQILLTHADLSSRERYLNARSAMQTLLAMGILPVVNENDSIATEEIRFGDNDTLAAMTVNLVDADVLVILTDQSGLFDSDPRLNPHARMIAASAASNPALDAMAGDSKGELGRGGMATKLLAARRAARSGAMTVIVSGHEPQNLRHLVQGQAVGTLLWPDNKPLKARRQWLAGHLIPRGRVLLDAGAVAVIKQQGRSVLAVGVIAVEGDFKRGDLILCCDAQGQEIARGLTNYNAAETQRIQGQPSQAFEALLGYVDEPELIHRDNLVVTVTA